MDWLNPRNIRASASTPEEEERHTNDVWYQTFGSYGMLLLGIFSQVDPLKRGFTTEYIGYAQRLTSEARRYLSSEYEQHPDLLLEIVRRCFYPTQVVPNTSGHAFVSREDLEKLAVELGVAIREVGDWEKFFSVP